MRILQPYQIFSKSSHCYLKQSVSGLWRWLHLFLYRVITLKGIFNHSQNDIFRRHYRINPHFEKPGQDHFHQWPIPPCLSPRLRQWEIENEENSLMQVRFAAKPKNPE